MTPAGRRRLLGGATRTALLPAAALAVHQLRFAFAFGRGSSAELTITGHAYLHSLVPWIVLLLALAAGAFLRALGQALGGSRTLGRYTLSFAALWLACTGALIALYVAQECLEGIFISGHPGGLAGIFGYGGWWAIPAALGVGLVLAAVLHGARWALDEIARRLATAVAPTPARPPSTRRTGRMPARRPLPLSSGWSDRGPPRLLAA